MKYILKVLQNKYFLAFTYLMQIYVGLGCTGIVDGFTSTKTVMAYVFGIGFILVGIMGFGNFIYVELMRKKYE